MINKNKILIIKRIYEKDSYVKRINNITILYVNVETYPGVCGKRYSTIYCDKKFLEDSYGTMMVKEVFRPMSNLSGGKGFIFI